MGNKLQYYCLNEPMTCDILPSQSVFFGHRLCAHQALHSWVPPEPDGGSVASAFALHPQPPHPHRERSHKRLDSLLPSPPPVPEHTINSAQSSESVPPKGSKLSRESRWAPSHGLCQWKGQPVCLSLRWNIPRFTNPPLSIL